MASRKGSVGSASEAARRLPVSKVTPRWSESTRSMISRMSEAEGITARVSNPKTTSYDAAR
jgi:hypothetical protein